jgi:hypothetical protein
MFIHTVKVPEEFDVLLPREKIEDRSFLRADPDAFLDLGHVFPDIKAGDLGGTCRRS